MNRYNGIVQDEREKKSPLGVAVDVAAKALEANPLSQELKLALTNAEKAFDAAKKEPMPIGAGFKDLATRGEIKDIKDIKGPDASDAKSAEASAVVGAKAPASDAKTPAPDAKAPAPDAKAPATDAKAPVASAPEAKTQAAPATPTPAAAPKTLGASAPAAAPKK